MKRKWFYSMLAVFLVFSMNTAALADKETGTTKEMLYIGGYDLVFAVDPETKEVTEIPVTGPARDMTWTRDGRTLFVNTEGRQTLAVIDTVKNERIDELKFTTNEYRSHIYGFDVDPAGELIYVMTMRSKREGVELKALPPAILVMDIKTKEIVKEIEVPYGTHTLQFYEDGSKIAVWGRDLYEYDIEKDELALHHKTMNPDDENTGISNYLYFWVREKELDNLSVATNYVFYPETGEVTEGYIAWDLKTGEVERIEFEEDPIGLFSGVITKDGKTAYGGMNMLVKTDLATLKHKAVVPTKLGSSYGFNISGDEKTIYVSGAGPDISFYDAETLEYQETIDLKSDTMDIRVVQIKQ